MTGSGGRRNRWLIVLGAVALTAAASAIDPAGIRRYRELSQKVREMRAENAQLAEDNARLGREVRALRSQPAALERAVREELRYIRPGERVYWLGEKGTHP